MYEPVKCLLSSRGFTVKGEVRGCDVTAVKDGDLWVVEMKLQFNMTLLFQAMNRLEATDFVFVAIPRPKRIKDKNFAAAKKVLTKLELGLITVAADAEPMTAEIVLFPGGKRANKNNKASRAVKDEMENRIGDTAGGVSGQAINTVYRERCIRIACVLEAKGIQTGKDFKGETRLLRDNFYGWFKKTPDGSFELSAAGRKYLSENGDNSAVAYYRIKADDMLY